MNKRWNMLYEDVDCAFVDAICKSAGVSSLIGLILAVRGVTPDAATAFFNCSLTGLHDPFLLKDMDKAVLRIKKAIADKEKITVYGDYDVDGISSVSMLLSYLKEQNADCAAYIPNRETEGYGLNKDAIRRIAQDGTKLIVTVDTGITACEEVAMASSLGVDAIITDHHSVPDLLPDAVAVINPKRTDCPYPYKQLAGGGVCFKLLCALMGDAKEAAVRFADIAALATIADVVSLTGENRVIASLGLRKIRKMPSLGIAAICTVSGISSESITAYQISFAVAPRLNAAGRMGDCMPAVQLLLTNDENEAAEIAAYLDRQNIERKTVGDEIYEQAMDMIINGDYKDKKVIVLHHENWHHGIIGIIASKITEHFYKSTLMISTDGEMAKGSGRSVPGLNLYEALSACSTHLTRFGGHALAAGLTLKTENIAALQEAINNYADTVMTDADLLPSINIDAPLSLSIPLLTLAQELEKLEPFGADNARPVFLLPSVQISTVRTSKDEKHLFLRLCADNASISTVGFGKGELAASFSRGDVVDVVGELQVNTYCGTKTPQLIIQDIKKHEH